MYCFLFLLFKQSLGKINMFPKPKTKIKGILDRPILRKKWLETRIWAHEEGYYQNVLIHNWYTNFVGLKDNLLYVLTPLDP